MEIKSREIQHTFRNKYLKYGGIASNYSLSNSASSSNIISKWFYEDEDGNLHSKLNFIGDNEISAYGAGDSGTGGDVTIIDNLSSTAIDCALSANMGRHLKSLIDSKTGISSWNELTDKPAELTDANMALWIDAASKKHEHSNKSVLDGITAAKITNWDNTAINSHIHTNKVVLDDITSTLVGNWNTAFTNNHTHSNKSVLDGITSTKVNNWDGVVMNWNKAFEFDADNNLRVKLNLIGEQEVSAYGAGSTGGSGAITIVDALTSTSVEAALSANQGRVLKSMIDSKSSVSSWDDLTDKPSTFTPSAHNHAIGDVANLQTILDGKATASHTHNYASIVKVGTTSYNVASNAISLPAYPTTLPASDVYAWAKASTKPSYDYSEVGAAASNHTHTDLKRIWDSTITIGSWSRLCYAVNINLGGSFLLSINYTRNSVVVNYTFLIAFGHNYNASITTLSPYGYTQIQLRLTMSDANNVYIELLDVNSGSGTQAVRCAASKIDCTLTTYTTYTAGGGTVGASTQTEIGRLKLNNNTLAFLTDNVNSATKLQAARTIWGQSFDGTSNVSGHLYLENGYIYRNVNGISKTVLDFHSDGSLALNYGLDGAGLPCTIYGKVRCISSSSDGQQVHKIVTYPTSPYGLITNILNTGAVQLQSQREYNNSECFPLILNPNGGNVGIGNNNPVYKLEAGGDIRCSGRLFVGATYSSGSEKLTVDGWVSTLGNCGWYSQNYGGGIYMEDSEYVRVYGGKRFHIPNGSMDAINVSGGLYSYGNGGYGLTVIGDEATTTRIKGRIGCNINGAISSYEVQWYNDYFRMNVHRGGSTDITKLSYTYNGNEIASLDMNGGFYTNYIRSNGSFSAGDTVADDTYGYYNCTRPTDGNQCCYAMVRSGAYPFGIGFNNSDFIIMGSATINKKINTWLSIGSREMYYYGNFIAAGEITAYSDARLKSDIKPLENRGYISPVTYTKDGKQSIGFVAQDVQKLYPELVTEGVDENKYLSMNYAQYVAVLQAQIIDLNKRLMQLETKRI